MFATRIPINNTEKSQSISQNIMHLTNGGRVGSYLRPFHCHHLAYNSF